MGKIVAIAQYFPQVHDGILRNAGYGANSLGGTERYMATVEKFVGNAEENYRKRSNNLPGRNA